jgi:AcrR family transcriptional regulator
MTGSHSSAVLNQSGLPAHQERSSARGMSMGVDSRKKRERELRRTSILEAARALFAEKDYQSTTMEEIAERAELSKGTLYLYFESKDDLYISIILEDFEVVESALIEIEASGSDLLEKGRSMFFAFVDHCLNNHDYFRINQYFMMESARRNISDRLVEEVNSRTARLLGYIVGLVREGIEDGRVRSSVEPEMFAVTAWRCATGLLDVVVSGDLAAAGFTDERRVFDFAFDLLIEGAVAGPRA